MTLRPHRSDLKPENFLLDTKADNAALKCTDFGEADNWFLSASMMQETGPRPPAALPAATLCCSAAASGLHGRPVHLLQAGREVP